MDHFNTTWNLVISINPYALAVVITPIIAAIGLLFYAKVKADKQKANETGKSFGIRNLFWELIDFFNFS